MIDSAVKLLHSDGIIRSTGLYAFDTAVDAFLFEDKTGYIKIVGGELSFASYVYFWERMLELQKLLKPTRRGRGRMVARVVHSGEIGPWVSRKSASLRGIKKIHRRFIDNGGSVLRIFLDDGQTGQLDHYIEAMTEMQDAKIKCAYVRKAWAPDIEPEDFESDFCLVDQYSSDWHFDPSHRVSYCEIGIRDSVYRDNLAKWQHYRAVLDRYRYEKDPELSDAQIAFFNAAKREFQDEAAACELASKAVAPPQ